MKSAAIAAIAVLVALLLTGAYFLGSRGEENAPMAIGRSGGSSTETDRPAALDALEVPDLEAASPGAQTTRTDATEESIARSGSLTLTAVDSVTGAAILKFWVKRSGTEDMASPAAPVLSDPASGEAVLPAASWDEDAALDSADFLVSAPLYEATLVTLEGPGARAASRTLKLARSSSIVGVVRDGASAPLPAARVTLEFLGSVPGLRAETSEPVPLPDAYQGPTLRRSDDAGRYSFDQLPPGSYRTRVERDGTLHVSDPVAVHPGRWTFCDHWLDEHVRVTVHVLAPDGHPAEGSRVLLQPAESSVSEGPPLTKPSDESGERLATRYTDEEGRATLGPIGAGRYLVFIQSDDGQATAQPLQVDDSGRSIVDLEFRLTESDAGR
ncbi:hypothetical protein Poly30_53730 [Planctomycetes bacterium Poly30]|uniref:Carboxypeptidase regulatory-like domain-containing protein n=1 Tax=Saltatorellus ferox TaxID=2528018 RepID=A0A518F0F4_9BACT|nr:hypothetical protein Poly30_53730 [Planctomycetes bacterium Poly30]